MKVTDMRIIFLILAWGLSFCLHFPNNAPNMYSLETFYGKYILGLHVYCFITICGLLCMDTPMDGDRYIFKGLKDAVRREFRNNIL